MLESLKRSKEEIERLEDQLVSVKDMAVEAIVEKEQMILELNDKLERMEASYKQQLIQTSEERRETQENQLKNFSFRRMSQEDFSYPVRMLENVKREFIFYQNFF